MSVEPGDLTDGFNYSKYKWILLQIGILLYKAQVGNNETNQYKASEMDLSPISEGLSKT